MTLINTAEIKKQIAQHKNEIRILEELLNIAGLLKGKPSILTKAKGVKPVKLSKRGRRPKRKRGAITDAIKELLNTSAKPMTAGEIKAGLENQGLAQKGSTTVYTTLHNLAKKGVIVKVGKGFSLKKLAQAPAKQTPKIILKKATTTRSRATKKSTSKSKTKKKV